VTVYAFGKTSPLLGKAHLRWPSSQSRHREEGVSYRSTPSGQFHTIINVEYVEDLALLKWQWVVLLWETWSKDIPEEQKEKPEDEITGHLGAVTGRISGTPVLKALLTLVMAAPEATISLLVPGIRKFAYTCHLTRGRILILACGW
jgi:hypothetical protein